MSADLARPGDPTAVAVTAVGEASALRASRTEATRLVVFTVPEALEAEPLIDHWRPGVVLLDEDFSVTCRGATVVSHARARECSHIRILSGSDYARIRRGLADPALETLGRPLATDFAGSQQTARVTICDGRTVRIGSECARLVNLSAGGAQVVTPQRLYPGRRLRFRLEDVDCFVSVVWVSFELGHTDNSPIYRAGLKFLDADTGAMAWSCREADADATDGSEPPGSEVHVPSLIQP